MEHIIRQYSLEAGALEAQYIEEYFTEFRRKKPAGEIIDRLKDREHLILVSMAPPDDDGTLTPVAYKIGHELRSQEANIMLSDLVSQLREVVDFRIERFSTVGLAVRARNGAAKAATAPLPSNRKNGCTPTDITNWSSKRKTGFIRCAQRWIT